MNTRTAQSREFPRTVTREELIVDGSDARLRKLLYELTTLAACIEDMRATFAGYFGITRPQYSVMLHIAQHQGDVGLTTTQVAQALKVTTAHVVAEVNHLMKAGLITKRRNPDDGRSVLLAVTDPGMQQIRDLSPVLQLVNDELFGSLTSDGFGKLAASVSEILEDAENVLVKLPGYMLQK